MRQNFKKVLELAVVAGRSAIWNDADVILAVPFVNNGMAGVCDYREEWDFATKFIASIPEKELKIWIGEGIPDKQHSGGTQMAG